MHPTIGHVRAVGEHGAGDQPLAARERQSEQQPRDRDRRGLPARGEQMETDGQEELPVLRIAEVEMVQHLARQQAPRPVHHFHAGAMERRVHGDEDLAEREPDHRFASAARPRHVHRGQLDHELMRPGVHQYGRTGQRFGTGAGAPGEQHDEEENGPHACCSRR